MANSLTYAHCFPIPLHFHLFPLLFALHWHVHALSQFCAIRPQNETQPYLVDCVLQVLITDEGFMSTIFPVSIPFEIITFLVKVKIHSQLLVCRHQRTLTTYQAGMFSASCEFQHHWFLQDRS